MKQSSNDIGEAIDKRLPFMDMRTVPPIRADGGPPLPPLDHVPDRREPLPGPSSSFWIGCLWATLISSIVWGALYWLFIR